MGAKHACPAQAGSRQAQVLNLWLGTVQLWAPTSKSSLPGVDEYIHPGQAVCLPAGSLPALLWPPRQLSQQWHGKVWGWRGGRPEHRRPWRAQVGGAEQGAVDLGRDGCCRPCAMRCLLFGLQGGFVHLLRTL